MILRVGKSMSWGFITGYFAALLLSRWTWLEMRMNTSFAILIFTLLGGVYGVLKNSKCSKKWFFSAEMLILIIFLTIYHDFGVLTIMPAIKLKEAFFLSSLSLSQANIVLLLLLFICNALWLIPHK